MSASLGHSPPGKHALVGSGGGFWCGAINAGNEVQQQRRDDDDDDDDDNNYNNYNSNNNNNNNNNSNK